MRQFDCPKLEPSSPDPDSFDQLRGNLEIVSLQFATNDPDPTRGGVLKLAKNPVKGFVVCRIGPQFSAVLKLARRRALPRPYVASLRMKGCGMAGIGATS